VYYLLIVSKNRHYPLDNLVLGTVENLFYFKGALVILGCN